MDAISRRAAIRGLTLAGLAAGWGVPVVAAPAPGQGTLAWAPRALSTAEARVLAAVTETIMPATDTPGAITADVPQFIDRTVADWCEPAEAEALRKVLARIDAEGNAAHGKGFAELSAPQQLAVLKAVDAEAAREPGHAFTRLKELVTAAYFTSEAGATQALRYDPVPGAYRGCVPLTEIGRAWAT